ncbi:MAG: transposase [Chloroflexota bacterium]
MYHINFHTSGNRPVFLDEAVDRLIVGILRETIKAHHIPCLALEVMPTHVHLIVADFPDFDRGKAMHLLKGAVARRFLAEQPDFREDLGEHLWQEGYSWREITSHRQLVDTLAYLRGNRPKLGLERARSVGGDSREP